jgi:hypothetical protein
MLVQDLIRIASIDVDAAEIAPATADGHVLALWRSRTCSDGFLCSVSITCMPGICFRSTPLRFCSPGWHVLTEHQATCARAWILERQSRQLRLPAPHTVAQRAQRSTFNLPPPAVGIIYVSILPKTIVSLCASLASAPTCSLFPTKAEPPANIHVVIFPLSAFAALFAALN